LHPRHGGIKAGLRAAIFGERSLRADAPDALLRHQLMQVVGQRDVMLDGPYSGLNRTASALLSLHMSSHFQPAGVGGFTDEELDVLHRVWVGLAVHADLDDFGAKQHVLPDRLDDLIRRVRAKI